ncbi:protein kinase domain-containing protein [Streptomyces parvulus]|uniref:protein kinase domain-containing protein n=1 Tax=Streptomyces parvulus TaxID=146923 RepID=UPI00341F4A9C
MRSTGGQRLVADRYLLVEPVGRGGMGTVWRATDQVLERVVAVKEMHARPSGEGNEERWERARREALAVARITHPHVINVYDFVREDDRAWLITEFIDGPSLAEHVARQGPLSPHRAAAVGEQLLDALGALHAVGVLHRDVKPANALLRPDGRVVLCDFGIATITGSDSLTVPGGILGSVEYIAPERLSGGAVGAASDLFSLGSTLVALLTGRSPFLRDTPAATLHAVLHEPADIPDTAAELRDLLQSLLRKEPEERPALAEASRALRGAADHAPASGDTRRWTGPVPAPARRPRRGIPRRWLGIAAALVLVGGGTVAAVKHLGSPDTDNGPDKGTAVAPKTLRVMTLNAWDAGGHVSDAAAAITREIKASGADVVALQESDTSLTSQIAADLGWHGHTDSGTDLALISRLTLQGQDFLSDADSGAEAVAVRVEGIWVYSVRLAPEDYGPYNACFDGESYEDIYAQEETRRAQAEAVARWTGSSPAVVGGDFNGPSHLDWTEDTKERHCGSVVEWPATKAFQDAGFEDSYRALHPDPATDRGETWSTVWKRNTDNDDYPEPQDRIDFVLHKGEATKALTSRTIGDARAWPSDHRAVLTTFRIS